MVKSKIDSQTLRRISGVQWAKYADWIREWTAGKRKMPRIVRLFGPENFKVRNNKIYLYDRELVYEQKRRNAILAEHEERFGGRRKLHGRLTATYLGISRRDIGRRHRKEERRQLKAEKQVTVQRTTFIVAPRPGHFQADLTYYDGDKIPVFALIDVFSRWVYIKRIKSKSPDDTVIALELAFKAFAAATRGLHSIYRLELDGGTEWEGKFRKFVQAYRPPPRAAPLGKERKHRLVMVAKPQPQRLIESFNGSLRQHVERVDWGKRAELDKILTVFNQDYNETIHSSTSERPVDLLALDNKRDLSFEHKRQLERARSKLKTRQRPARAARVGSNVRLYTFAPSSKGKLGHRGNKPHWSKTIYTIKSILRSSRGADRYRIGGGGGTLPGYFFRDRLQVVDIPIHMAKPAKYSGDREGPTDEERAAAELAKRPDLAPVLKWANEKKYAGAEDERASSGEEASGDSPLASEEDEKLAEPPPTRAARPRRRVKPKPAFVWLGRKITLRYGADEVYPERGVVLEDYKSFLICLFPRSKTIRGFARKEVEETSNDFWTAATVKRKRTDHADAITKEKRRLDKAAN